MRKWNYPVDPNLGTCLLKGTNFTNAILTNAIVSSAQLEDAIIEGKVLVGVSITSSRPPRVSQFSFK